MVLAPGLHRQRSGGGLAGAMVDVPMTAPEPVEHELKYRPGASGMAHLGIPNNSQPHWYCTCGRWRKDRNLRGQPFRETAEKHHRKHVREATS
jgi:hypothetical protein